jgi:hypothetical protein
MYVSPQLSVVSVCLSALSGVCAMHVFVSALSDTRMVTVISTKRTVTA